MKYNVVVWWLLLIRCSIAQVNEQTVINKVDEYFLRNEQQLVGNMNLLYSPKVDYYKSGIVDLNFIIKDKKAYFERFPYRHFKLYNKINVMGPDDKNRWTAKFTMYYNVKNSKKNLEGYAWCELIFNEQNNYLLICSEKGEVLKTPDVSKTVSDIAENKNISIKFSYIEDPAKPSAFYQQKENNKLIGVFISVKNKTDKKYNFIVRDFRLYDENNKVYKPALGLTEQQIMNGEFEPLEERNGIVPFEIPNSAKTMILTYISDAKKSEIKILVSSETRTQKSKVNEIDNNSIETQEKIQEEPEKEAEQIFTYVEGMPTYPGGDEALYTFIGKQIVYPEIAKRAGVEGKLYIQFVVRKDGRLTDVTVQKGIGAGCDEEAVRVVKSMPNWKPGRQNGHPVNVRISIPIVFKLQG